MGEQQINLMFQQLVELFWADFRLILIVSSVCAIFGVISLWIWSLRTWPLLSGMESAEWQTWRHGGTRVVDRTVFVGVVWLFVLFIGALWCWGAHINDPIQSWPNSELSVHVQYNKR